MEMPCKHSFHKKCIEPWIITKGTCPMCKINIFQELGLQTREQVEEERAARAGNGEGEDDPTQTTTVTNIDNLEAGVVNNSNPAYENEQVSPSMVMTNLNEQQGNDIHFADSELENENELSDEERTNNTRPEPTEQQPNSPTSQIIESNNEQISNSNNNDAYEESISSGSRNNVETRSRPGSRSRFSEPDGENVTVVKLEK